MFAIRGRNLRPPMSSRSNRSPSFTVNSFSNTEDNLGNLEMYRKLLRQIKTTQKELNPLIIEYNELSEEIEFRDVSPLKKQEILTRYAEVQSEQEEIENKYKKITKKVSITNQKKLDQEISFFRLELNENICNLNETNRVIEIIHSKIDKMKQNQNSNERKLKNIENQISSLGIKLNDLRLEGSKLSQKYIEIKENSSPLPTQIVQDLQLELENIEQIKMNKKNELEKLKTQFKNKKYNLLHQKSSLSSRNRIAKSQRQLPKQSFKANQRNLRSPRLYRKSRTLQIPNLPRSPPSPNRCNQSVRLPNIQKTLNYSNSGNVMNKSDHNNNEANLDEPANNFTSNDDCISFC